MCNRISCTLRGLSKVIVETLPIVVGETVTIVNISFADWSVCVYTVCDYNNAKGIKKATLKRRPQSNSDLDVT